MSAYETVINSLYEVKDWGRLEVLQEVVQWLDENFFTGEVVGYYSDVPDIIVHGKFDCKEQMLQSFKERFNIE